jgi:hypothetical protein
VHWRPSKQLRPSDIDTIKQLLSDEYYIILTRRHNHLSTFMTAFANFFLTGKWGYWSHALMNMEDEVKSDTDFRLVEAIGDGVTFTPFEKVFDVDAAVLLRPRGLSAADWTTVFDALNDDIGKPYDTLFDLKNDSSMSCVELVRSALQKLPDYETRFARFEALIAKRKNLTPQMFYDCEDFIVEYQIIR